MSRLIDQFIFLAAHLYVVALCIDLISRGDKSGKHFFIKALGENNTTVFVIASLQQRLTKFIQEFLYVFFALVYSRT